jgi:hypothetical protein
MSAPYAVRYFIQMDAHGSHERADGDSAIP